jgi:hypothetical protein
LAATLLRLGRSPTPQHRSNPPHAYPEQKRKCRSRCPSRHLNPIARPQRDQYADERQRIGGDKSGGTA